MDPESPRWKRITASAFAWERDALDYLCSRLPDQEPYRAWANFEFITNHGSIYEVDVAVLTPRGFFVVEIKSWRGELTGDAATWIRRVGGSGGRPEPVDNPLLLTNKKAKTLRSLVANTPSGRRLRADFPFVEPLVFLSLPGLKVDLDPIARTGVYGRGGSAEHPGAAAAPGRRGLPGIIGYLTAADGGSGRRPGRTVTSATADLLTKAMDEAGIRPSRRSVQAGDYDLRRLLTEGPGFQDFEATHRQLPSRVRRARVYANARGSSAEQETARRRAAERECEVLERLKHPGVLAVENLTTHERGPALIFEHDRTAQRLDHWIAEHGGRLSLEVRLDVVRQLVDVLRYAHSRRVAHRALSPHTVLVSGEPTEPIVKVFSWQTAGRAGAGNGTTSLPQGTSHLDALVDDAATAYLAPEALTNPDADGAALDVFSVGAVAYLVLTGQAPAASGIELLDVIRAGNGLQLPAVLDGVGERLREVIAQATRPDVVHRYDSMEWLALDFDEALAELRPDEPPVEVRHPADAKPGDQLGHFEVVRQLGKGSTAVALLVRDDEGAERVLKVALDESLDEFVRDEAAVLADLTHQTIVRSHGFDTVGGRAAVLLAKAGDRTLARHLREEGALGIDMLQRWGGDLLDAVVFLEHADQVHRDIKPDNLGIVPLGKNEEPHLVLFDFSLARAPLANIRAGTPPYLEPFLVDRPGRRWDQAAERYAVAVTLYEMATGTTPVWGDGRSDPASVVGEVQIETDRFPSSVRDGMHEFFVRALRRDPSARFDTAEDMRRAWNGLFAAADQASTTSLGHEPIDVDVIVARVERDAPLAELGLSPRTLDVLERLDVLTVDGLLATSEQKIRVARGVANKVRRQILDVRAALRRRFPDEGAPVGQGRRRSAATDDGADVPADSGRDVQSLDLLTDRLVPVAGRRSGRSPEVVRLLLGLDPAMLPARWPSQTEVAEAAGVTSQRVSQIVADQRRRWAGNRSLGRLRDEITSLLHGLEGVGTVEELADAVTSLRGLAGDHPDPVALGRAAVRAACEVEGDRPESRWVQRRSGEVVVLASAVVEWDGTVDAGEVAVTPASSAAATERADWAARLGRAAAELAERDPLPSPSSVLSRLRAVTPPEGEPLMSDGRLVRLAAAMTTTAAVSARLELYPRGLDARRALRLAQNALLVPAGRGADQSVRSRLTLDHVEARLRARYPEMAALPRRRQVLDEWFQEAGVPLVWEGSGADAGYVMQATTPAGLTSLRSRNVTTGQAGDTDEAAALVEATEDRLARAATAGGFLALTVGLDGVEAAAEALARFGMERVSIESRLLVRLHERVEEKGVDWARVVEADAVGPGSPDWRRLSLLMELAWNDVDADVRAAGPAVVLTELGPLKRYGAMARLETWRDATLDPASGLRTVWLLVPARGRHERPGVDGAVVPMLGDSQWARLSHTWLEGIR